MRPEILIEFGAAGMGVAITLVALLGSPRTLSRWAFAAGMTLLACDSLFAGLTEIASTPEIAAALQTWRMISRSLIPAVWLLFSLAFSRANALDFLRQWNVALAILFVFPPAIALVFSDDLILVAHHASGAMNLRLGTTGHLLHIIFAVGAVLVLMNLERTFRATVGTMRWKIKFMVLGLGLVFAVRLFSSSQALVFTSALPDLGSINSAGLLIGGALILVSLARAGFAEVNVFPSQAVLRNSFTLLLAGAYMLIVGIIAKAAEFLGGDTGFATKMFAVLIIIVLVGVVLVSDRARMQAKRFYSRYFQRPLYDYGSVWRSFTANTSARVDPGDFSRAVVHLVSELFQALSVTLWLVDEKRQAIAFGASTSLADAGSAATGFSADQTKAVINTFRDRRDPIEINASTEPWAAALRQCNPEAFKSGAQSIAVPINAGGELYGILTLGDRVGGVHFIIQEIDLLKCISDQTAASLRNLQLSNRLMHAKELEAFQTMSAFFVHDLKNTASTLSLMLRNLPVHFNDPAFREDALRGISRTVTHINDIIGRLTLLRQELAIRPVESDLNQLVSTTLAELNAGNESRMRQDLGAVPKVLLDPEQIRKVVTNLVINAREASGANGEIRIVTSAEKDWAVLSVIDNGCGMSREFMDRSLFRPFQTTKKQGIGIGMFQSRMIVEAHRGKIEVESEPGRGTTFRVFLPHTKNHES